MAFTNMSSAKINLKSIVLYAFRFSFVSWVPLFKWAYQGFIAYLLLNALAIWLLGGDLAAVAATSIVNNLLRFVLIDLPICMQIYNHTLCKRAFSSYISTITSALFLRLLAIHACVMLVHSLLLYLLNTVGAQSMSIIAYMAIVIFTTYLSIKLVLISAFLYQYSRSPWTALTECWKTGTFSQRFGMCSFLLVMPFLLMKLFMLPIVLVGLQSFAPYTYLHQVLGNIVITLSDLWVLLIFYAGSAIFYKLSYIERRRPGWTKEGPHWETRTVGRTGDEAAGRNVKPS